MMTSWAQQVEVRMSTEMETPKNRSIVNPFNYSSEKPVIQGTFKQAIFRLARQTGGKGR